MTTLLGAKRRSALDPPPTAHASEVSTHHTAPRSSVRPQNTVGLTTPSTTTITVQGAEYELPTAPDEQIMASGRITAKYAMNFLPRPPTPLEICKVDLTAKLMALRSQLSRAAAEEAALADAGNFVLDESRLNRDITQLRDMGSLDALLRAHHRQQQVSGMNAVRIQHWLKDDPDLEKILQICEHGVIADTDPNFHCTERVAPLRELQRRLAPVYYKAAAGMHDTNKVLLFRVSDLTEDERGQLHMANEYH